MNDQTDSQLLRAYAEHRSETAFAELVRRHVDLVYSAALRMVCDSHLAQDVTQGVFVALAKNAAPLTDRPVLSGWLHRTAHNIAAQTVRTDVRRRAREQEAAAMNELLAAGSDVSWEYIAPHLDAALDELSEPDRNAVLLRYFEKKTAQEMAERLGISDEAAQKRVARAVERLRSFLDKRGVSVGASRLLVVISANAVQAAPVGLAVTISTAAALAGTTMAATATATTTKVIAMTTLQKTLVTATIAVLAGAGIYEARQASQLGDRVHTFEQQQAPLVEQIAILQKRNEGLSNRVTEANRLSSVGSGRLRELLKLRGEVGVLRRRQGELENALVAESKTSGAVPRPALPASSESNVSAPFRIQLVLDEPGADSETMTNHTGGVNAETLHVQKTPLMDATAIRAATATRNPSSGLPEIDVEFSEVGAELFAAITRENLNKRLAIVLNGHLYSAPVIRSEIAGGKAQITGDFSEDEAVELAAKINEIIGNQ